MSLMTTVGVLILEDSNSYRGIFSGSECYHPAGASGPAYMPSTAGGAPSSAQAALRVPQTPQPSAPPAPQQDMSKTTMVMIAALYFPNV